jgi:hypothetical protein
VLVVLDPLDPLSHRRPINKETETGRLAKRRPPVSSGVFSFRFSLAHYLV